METRAKLAYAILALAVCCSPAFAQGGAPQNPPPPPGPPGAQQGPAFIGRAPYGRAGGPGGPGRPGGPGEFGPRFGGFNGGRGMRWGRGRMGPRARGMGEPGLDGRFLENPQIRQRLGITAQQTARIHELTSDFQKSQIRARADLEVNRIELRDLLGADNPDRAAIDAKLQEVSAAQGAMEKLAVDHQLDVRAVLTPAQRQQLEQMRTNGFRTRFGPNQPVPPRPGRTVPQRGGPQRGGQPNQPPPSQPQANQ